MPEDFVDDCEAVARKGVVRAPLRDDSGGNIMISQKYIYVTAAPQADMNTPFNILPKLKLIEE